MTPEQFTYWLKGFFEISNSAELSEVQVSIIKDHLDLVFKKVTPNRNNDATYCNNIGFPSKKVSYGESHDGATAIDKPLHSDGYGLQGLHGYIPYPPHYLNEKDQLLEVQISC
jgi:hypothetical protein